MWDTPPWKGVCNTRTCVRGYSRGGECGTLWQKKGTGPSPGGDCNSFATPVCWFDILPMFTFAAETTKDMKKHLVLLSAVLLVQTAVVSVFAQQKPNAGDIISGIVTDSVSPLMAVYITELDSADRVVAYAYSDLKGEFSFRLVNPADRIHFSFYRKERIILPIDKAFFEIRMEDDKNLPPVSWEDFKPLGPGLVINEAPSILGDFPDTVKPVLPVRL